MVSESKKKKNFTFPQSKDQHWNWPPKKYSEESSRWSVSITRWKEDINGYGTIAPGWYINQLNVFKFIFNINENSATTRLTGKKFQSRWKQIAQLYGFQLHPMLQWKQQHLDRNYNFDNISERHDTYKSHALALKRYSCSEQQCIISLYLPARVTLDLGVLKSVTARYIEYFYIQCSTNWKELHTGQWNYFFFVFFSVHLFHNVTAQQSRFFFYSSNQFIDATKN